MTIARDIWTEILDLLEGPVDRGFCPTCGRWVNLNPLWGCRFCHDSRTR